MTVVTDTSETSFETNPRGARLQGRGTCIVYTGQEGVSPELGGRQVTTQPCTWTFNADRRSGRLSYGTSVLATAYRDW